MQHFDVIGEIRDDGHFVAKLPPGVAVGRCRALVIVEAKTEPAIDDGAPVVFPEFFVTLGPPDQTFRREDLYGDDGR